jgi:hypothetical protein
VEGVDDAHAPAVDGAGDAHGDGGHGGKEGAHGGHESIFMEALSLDQKKVRLVVVVCVYMCVKHPDLTLLNQQTKQVGMMMAFIIIAQLVLDGGLRRVEGSVGASSKVLLAEIYKELATVSVWG